MEKKILVVAVMLAVPAMRETVMMLALGALALAFTARSFEPKPAYARVKAVRRKN